MPGEDVQPFPGPGLSASRRSQDDVISAGCRHPRFVGGTLDDELQGRPRELFERTDHALADPPCFTRGHELAGPLNVAEKRDAVAPDVPGASDKGVRRLADAPGAEEAMRNIIGGLASAIDMDGTWDPGCQLVEQGRLPRPRCTPDGEGSIQAMWFCQPGFGLLQRPRRCQFHSIPRFCVRVFLIFQGNRSAQQFTRLPILLPSSRRATTPRDISPSARRSPPSPAGAWRCPRPYLP